MAEIIMPSSNNGTKCFEVATYLMARGALQFFGLALLALGALSLLGALALLCWPGHGEAGSLATEYYHFVISSFFNIPQGMRCD